MVEEAEVLAITNIDLLNMVFSGLIARLVLAVLIILIGFILAKFVGRFAGRVFKEIELNSMTRKVFGKRLAAEEFLSTAITYTIYLISIIAGLNQLMLTRPVLYLSSLAVLVLAIFSTVLGIKEFIPNAIAGILLRRRKLVATGSSFRMKNLSGQVRKIGLTQTCLETEQGDTVYLPNLLVRKVRLSRAG